MDNIFGGGHTLNRNADGSINYVENRINGETWRWIFVYDANKFLVQISNPEKIDD